MESNKSKDLYRPCVQLLWQSFRTKIFPYREKQRRLSIKGKNISGTLEICMIVLFVVHWHAKIACQELERNLILEPVCFVLMKKYPRNHALHSRLIPGYQNCNTT